MTAYKVFSLVAICLSLTPISSPALAESGESKNNEYDLREYYRFGVFPLESPIKLAHLLMPLVDQLEHVLEKPVQFLTAPDISTFNKRAVRQEYDIIYLYPQEELSLDYIGYKVISELIGDSFTGILVVRKEGASKIMGMTNFPDGVEIGLPSDDFPTTSMMTRQNLRCLGLDINWPLNARFFGSHDSALLGLHYGLVDVVATWKISLDSMPDSVRNKLQVVKKGNVEPKMLFAVREDMPEIEVTKLKNLLLGLSKDEQGYRSLINPIITIEKLSLEREKAESINNKY